MTHSCRSVLLALLLAWSSGPLADSKHFTEIEYDPIGRVSAIETAVEEAPPVVTGIFPSVVRHGPAVSITITGTSLRGAIPATAQRGISIDAVTAEASRVTLRMQVDESVTLGEHVLTVTTVLGSADVAFAVRPRLPVLTVSPSPVAVEPGASMALELRTDRADVVGHSFTLSTSSSANATVAPGMLLLPVGNMSAGVATISGVTGGTAVLRVESDEIEDVLVPVFVTPRYVPPPGGASFYATPLGVLVGSPVPPPELVPRGPFTALVGVVMPSVPPGGALAIGPVASSVLGIGVGPVVRSLRPDRVVRGAGPAVVEVLGSGLGALASVALSPAEGVQIAVSSVDPDGRRAVLEATAEPSAALGPRAMQLTTGTGQPIAFGVPGGGQLHIVEPLPELDSVAPILLVRGASSTLLTMRGRRLAGASAVRLSPADGITVGGTPVVNDAGTELSVHVATGTDAPLGARVVTVVTASGESSNVAIPANTVQVVAGLAGAVTPVASPLLGVRVEALSGGETSERLLAGAPLGLSVGPAFTGLRPQAGAVGTELLLEVDGHGLHAVTGIAFEPPDGVTLSPPAVSSDGRIATAQLSIAADAPRGIRRVRLATAGGEVLVSDPAAAQFRITDPPPVIDSVVPLELVAGAAPTTLTVRGHNLGDAVHMRLAPADGAAISGVSANQDGTSLSATVVVDAGAAPGPRAVVVDTPTASTPEDGSAANTVRIVAAAGTPLAPLAAPLLGVTRGSDGTAARAIELVGPVLGVEIATTPPVELLNRLLASPVTSVVIGPAARLASPRYLPVGQAATLRIEGVGLDAVTTLEVQPDQGITLGLLEHGADGALSVPVVVDAAAEQTARSLLLRDGSGQEVPFAVPAAATVRIVGNEPRIDSIEPIQVTPGRTVTLIIRGANLFGVSAVTATPGTGLTFSANPAGNADGTLVQVAVTVAADAPGIPHVIRVVASTGTTTDQSVPANTLTVVTGQ